MYNKEEESQNNQPEPTGMTPEQLEALDQLLDRVDEELAKRPPFNVEEWLAEQPTGKEAINIEEMILVRRKLGWSKERLNNLREYYDSL